MTVVRMNISNEQNWKICLRNLVKHGKDDFDKFSVLSCSITDVRKIGYQIGYKFAHVNNTNVFKTFQLWRALFSMFYNISRPDFAVFLNSVTSHRNCFLFPNRNKSSTQLRIEKREAIRRYTVLYPDSGYTWLAQNAG